MQATGAPSLNVESATAQMELTTKNKSVLEMGDLNDFILRADMAQKEFDVEREGMLVLDEVGREYKPNGGPAVLLDGDAENLFGSSNQSDFHFQELSVPRRPAWDEDTTPEELHSSENESFLEWRRGIAHYEESLLSQTDSMGNNSMTTATTATPFEKNLNVWRQLWRVLERSDVLIQIVDARNPLFYYSRDLHRYACDELGKPMMVILNKSDFLSVKQREIWSAALKEMEVDHVFFSAVAEQTKLDAREEDAPHHHTAATDNGILTPLTRSQLLTHLQSYAASHNLTPNPRYDGRIQYGMVGFPNVGKSSVINVLMGASKHTHDTARVGVAAQPGKTKHFATLIVSNEILLCDCPGLVFPSFVSGGSAGLIAAGVFPIAQMRDVYPPVSLICNSIPRRVLDATYGITVPVPTTYQLRERGLSNVPEYTTPQELLDTYCIARSLMATASGVPDHQRAARVLVKDYVVGRLLYCHAPPTLADKPEAHTEFQRESIQTSMKGTENVKKRLEKAMLQMKTLQDETTQINAAAEAQMDQLDDELAVNVDAPPLLDEDVDQDMLELLGMDANSSTKEPNVKKYQHKKPPKRKKGRKNIIRSDDPYGCHTEGVVQTSNSSYNTNYGKTSDEIQKGGGIVVNAGKYGGKGYVRPNYAGARGAVLHETVDTSS